jgi:hypothetical protein
VNETCEHGFSIADECASCIKADLAEGRGRGYVEILENIERWAVASRRRLEELHLLVPLHFAQWVLREMQHAKPGVVVRMASGDLRLNVQPLTQGWEQWGELWLGAAHDDGSSLVAKVRLR